MPAVRCAKCSRWLSMDEAGQPCPRCGSRDVIVFDRAQQVADEKATVARSLAEKHYQAEAGLQKVVRLIGSADVEMRPAEPIKLLEVNANTIPSGVVPVGFGPAPASGIPYSSIIVEVSPEEFVRIRSHELNLPMQWELGEELPRPNDAEPGS